MFHRRLNELRLTLRLQPAAPLLIKAGEDPADYLVETSGGKDSGTSFRKLVKQEKQAIRQRKKSERDRRERQKQARDDGRGKKDKLDLDMKFVRTWRRGSLEPYLPGSSLKGVLRNRCEQLAATFDSSNSVCNLFLLEGSDPASLACTKKVENLPAADRYRTACSICKLFGCGGLAGRLSVSDAYLLQRPGEDAYTSRSGVGINRQRGAAETGALFFYEALQKGVFTLTLTLENFELWHLGLVAYTLDDLFQGRLPVGYGTRRGLGRMQGKVEDASLSYFGSDAQKAGSGCYLRGIDQLAPEFRASYGFVPEGEPATLTDATLQSSGLRWTWQLPEQAVEEMWQAGATAWVNTWNRQETET